MLTASRSRRTLDIWPGFVDALAALLMVVIFVLLLFSLGQFLLNDALVGRDAALSRLNNQLKNISSLLAQTRTDKAELEQRLQGVNSELRDNMAERDDLQAQLAVLNAQAHEAELALAALRLELDSSRAKLSAKEQLAQQQTQQIQALEATRTQLQDERELLRGKLETSREQTQQAKAASEDLGGQLAELNAQIARLSSALEVSEASLKDRNLEVADLGARLNAALVDKVEELAEYRSEFFGKLREALKDNPDVRIEGDRFLLPSEVLFPSASAELDNNGQREIAKVAHTLKEIMAKIPGNMEWVLRVDGHTDRRPIRVAFASNWELSSARATSIVKELIEEGIPPEHLVAAGFAQYHPLDSADTPEAYRRNRRIELKLTSR